MIIFHLLSHAFLSIVDASNVSSSLINSRYGIVRNLYRGSFGEVFVGLDVQRNVQVAIKFEIQIKKVKQLSHEYSYYKLLKGGG